MIMHSERKRFRYQRLDSEHGYCGKVIVELGRAPLDDKSMEFYDQEYGEVRWYQFEPDELEQKEVRQILAKQLKNGTDQYVQIDLADLRRRRERKRKAVALARTVNHRISIPMPQLVTCVVA